MALVNGTLGMGSQVSVAGQIKVYGDHFVFRNGNFSDFHFFCENHHFYDSCESGLKGGGVVALSIHSSRKLPA